MLKTFAFSGQAARVTSKLDAIFFDFDGVLVESVDIKTRAFAYLYAPFGEDVVAKVVAHHESHGGMGREEKLRHYHRHFLGRSLEAGPLSRLCAEFSGLVESSVVSAPAVAGSEEALAGLFGSADLYVISATPTEELRRIVAARNIARYFAEIHGGPAEKAQVMRHIIEMRDYDASRCLMIGDSLQDHASACEVGMPFIGRVVRGDVNRFPAGCYTIPDLKELVAMCQSRVAEVSLA